MPADPKLCLVAGAGRLPVEAARCLAEGGIETVAVGFEGLTDPALEVEVARLRWQRLGRLADLLQDLRELEVERLLLVGKVPKTALIGGEAIVDLDEIAVGLLAGAGDRGDETLMQLVCGWLDAEGFDVAGQQELLRGLVVEEGVIGGRAPSDGERADLEYGCPIACRLGELGVGQCVVVKGRAVLAVEAIEGTDETIRRAGRLGGAGATVIKIARPGQDRRLDLPTVGPETIRVMQQAGATGLALEAGVCLLLERRVTIAAADRAGIALWAFDAAGLTSG